MHDMDNDVWTSVDPEEEDEAILGVESEEDAEELAQIVQAMKKEQAI